MLLVACCLMLLAEKEDDGHDRCRCEYANPTVNVLCGENVQHHTLSLFPRKQDSAIIPPTNPSLTQHQDNYWRELWDVNQISHMIWN